MSNWETFICAGCGELKNWKEWVYCVYPQKGDVMRFCGRCHRGDANVPDVYWDGQPEHGLADDPQTGQPRVFFSKGQKAQYLKERGLMEAGDRVHGAPVQLHKLQNRPTDKAVTREKIRQVLAEVKKMSPSYRRQEYQRILKEGRA